MKACPKCSKSMLPEEYLYLNRRGRHSYCLNCRRKYQKTWREQHPEQARVRQLRLYGITTEEYDSLFVAQGGVCAVCGSHDAQMGGNSSYLQVDHDHKTGEVRGLLCGKCNKALGLFGDNKELLVAAYDYLDTLESLLADIETERLYDTD